MVFNSVVLTEAGIELLARAQVDKARIEFTRAVTGNGEYKEGESLLDRTALKGQRQEFAIISKGVRNAATVYLKWIITNDPESGPLTAGYYVREIGVYARDAKDPEAPGPEVLYAISTAEEGKADWLPAYNDLLPATITIDFYVEVANAANVTIKAGAGAYASAEDLEELRQKVDSLEMKAMAITYDHSGSALPAENVQDAIDALAATVNDVQTNLMATEIATVLLQKSEIAGMSGNMAVEAFLDGNDIQLLDGQFDLETHRLYA